MSGNLSNKFEDLKSSFHRVDMEYEFYGFVITEKLFFFVFFSTEMNDLHFSSDRHQCNTYKL